jgi:hypothetical protein
LFILNFSLPKSSEGTTPLNGRWFIENVRGRRSELFQARENDPDRKQETKQKIFFGEKVLYNGGLVEILEIVNRETDEESEPSSVHPKRA